MGIEHKKHVFRIFILLGAIIVSALIGRIFMVPASFGMYGHYRADNVAEQGTREARHAGSDAKCVGCHESHAAIKNKHDAGPHARVPCEDCHDAIAVHVKDGKRVAAMPKVTSITHLCARCHRRLSARPANFPQVNIKTHPVEKGAEKATDEVCFDCHSPHDPTP